MIDSLAREYDADQATLRREVCDCLNHLHDRLLIVFAQDSLPSSITGAITKRRAQRARSKKPAFKYRPYLLLAELTHRCPLHCPYCSNPSSYPTGPELTTADWRRVLEEAAALGILHVGFSGGEPLQRSDLPELVATARKAGLYSNLITSAIGFTPQR